MSRKISPAVRQASPEWEKDAVPFVIRFLDRPATAEERAASERIEALLGLRLQAIRGTRWTGSGS